MGNYFRGSEAEAEKILEEHFREEELEGRMKPISQKEAAKQYPGKALRIAAQGMLDKPDGGHRIIYDGTHGVRLNNEIQILDKLENPGPRELATIMKASAEAGEHVIFAINSMQTLPKPIGGLKCDRQTGVCRHARRRRLQRWSG